jgi:predicted GH43/DUF377 family glycosyl hydrolase
MEKVISQEISSPLIRDIQVLEDMLRENPNNIHNIFDLAQKYRDMALEDQVRREEFIRKAIEMYQRCFDVGGGCAEEMYYSLFQIGVLYERLNIFPEALNAYLAAFDFRPTRCEALSYASTMARIKGKNSIAVMIAKQALAIPFSNDKLFVDRDCWRVMPLYNISISAFYTPERHLGLAAIERLLTDRTLSHNPHIKQCLNNLYFYVPPLQEILGININLYNLGSSDIIRRLFPDSIVSRMYPMNPSLAHHNGKIMLNVRFVNYIAKPPLSYEFSYPEDNGKAITLNVMGSLNVETNEWNSDSNSENVQLIEDQSAAFYPIGRECSQGCEDMRLISFNGRLWATFNSREAVPGQIRLVLGRFNESLNQLDHMVLLHGDGIKKIEKNWLFYVVGNKLRFIYSTDPLIIYRINTTTGHCEPIVNKTCPLQLDLIRGSTSPVWIEEEKCWLYVTHEVLFRNGGRVYLHRFIRANGKMELEARSRPFYFEEKQIEFCSGMIRVGDELLLTYGVWDHHARLIRIPLKKVLDSLYSTDKF